MVYLFENLSLCQLHYSYPSIYESIVLFTVVYYSTLKLHIQYFKEILQEN